jgi:hypothetical protein
MYSSSLNDLAIIVEKQGPTPIPKAIFPLRYGQYSEIRTRECEFVFNLNGEIKYIRGLTAAWPHPAEQLKRTDGNDWVYYTVGDDSSDKGIISWLGEYYLPCLPYPSNPIWEVNYLSKPEIMTAYAAWPQLYANLYADQNKKGHHKARDLIHAILQHDDNVLHERSSQLHSIIGGRVSVLPPDTRHVDYDIIPVHISDGCLYHCKFCCVKSDRAFQPRSRGEILNQIVALKDFYGHNIVNYWGLFLGNHDALEAGEELISFAASEAYNAFGLGRSGEITPFLFLFGSVHSLIKPQDRLFDTLSRLPFYTYINIGLESIHPPTLAQIGKAIDGPTVREAFNKMLDINATYRNIEITANFVLGEGLAIEHYASLKALLESTPDVSPKKGCIYLSPLRDSPRKRELLPLINEIKRRSRLPVYIYLIQRL